MEPNISGQIRTAVFARGYQEPVTVAQLAMITGIGAGAISTRIKAMIDHRIQIDGVMAGRDHLSRTCAWRSVPLPGHRITPWGQEVRIEAPTSHTLAVFPADSIHNPVVECCKRDAADCDCHPLAVMYAETKAKHGKMAENIEEMAREVAISVISTAGYGTHDKDIAGEPMGDTVQSLLMVAFMRVPSVGQVIEQALDRDYAVTRKPPAEAESAFTDNVEARFDLTVGKKYRITYKSDVQRVLREAVMEYVGEEGDNLIWSARPAAGTQKMGRSSLISVGWVPTSTACYIDKMIRD